MRIIEVPDWAAIGNTVLIRDTECDRGDDPSRQYPERIISYGYDGIFTQAYNCPVYFTPFSSFGDRIKTLDAMRRMQDGIQL